MYFGQRGHGRSPYASIALSGRPPSGHACDSGSHAARRREAPVCRRPDLIDAFTAPILRQPARDVTLQQRKHRVGNGKARPSYALAHIEDVKRLRCTRHGQPRPIARGSLHRQQCRAGSLRIAR
ncbi:conserved hypothetical protein [Ralstonia solanacearum K60]|nr:conserved hypothetical protein [Ralstonia solanacearum K60]